MKYFRDILDDFARGVEEVRKAFAKVVKQLRHILQGFCKGWQTRTAGLLHRF